MNERPCRAQWYLHETNTILECGRKVGRKKHSKGYCGMHYMRLKNGVDMDAPPLVMRNRGCAVEGCTNKHKGHGFCEKHMDRWKNNGDPLVTQRTMVPDDSPKGYRTCTECGETKGESEFYQHPVRGYFDRRCKTCRKISARVNYILRKYGPEASAIEERLQRGELCDICHKRTGDAIDHDHETGAVRGLLCRLCNAGLGSLHDDIDVLQSAIDYLKRYTCE